MKASASIIAIAAAMFASQATVEAKRSFWKEDGTIAKCKVRGDAVDGGIFMFQATPECEGASDCEPEPTFMRTMWKDLDQWDLFDE